MNCAKYQPLSSKNKTDLLTAAFFVVAFSILLISCGKDDDDINRDDREYLPLRKGWYQVYEVEETRYELGIPTTLRYELKTVVTDSFPSAVGGYIYVIQRTRKYQGSDSWEPDQTWGARLTNSEAIVTHGSIPYVVLVFPSRKGAKWNGNAYNSQMNPGADASSDQYEIVESNAPIEIGGNRFPDCVRVVQEDNDDIIVFSDLRTEIYARGVGLVEREVIQLQYCNDEDRGCVGMQVIDAGVIYNQRILSYGIE